MTAPADTPGLASRRAAYAALRRVHGDGAWSQSAVDAALRRSGLDTRDRSFAANLAYSTLRWEGSLDWALARVLTRPLADVQPELLDVLRLGAWQLLYGGTPDRSAVGTAVDLARNEVGPQSTGFVNGVLRGLSRQRDQLPWPSEDSDEGLGLALGYPAWVVAEARDTFGACARDVLDAGNIPPGLTLRATGDRDALVAELSALGLAATAGLTPEGVRAPGGDPATLPPVAEGRALAQDEASMLVVGALAASAAPVSGKLVLDVCAAPGGKSTHLAALGARVAAADLRPGRAALVARTAHRVAAQLVGVVAADGLAAPWRHGSLDAVLLDAPCTGLGVVRRRPEVRWRRDPGDPERLGELQGQLLGAAARLVRPGGTLVYSVCTWTRAETVEVVAGFLAAHGDRFAPRGVAAFLPAGVAERGGQRGSGFQLDPYLHDTDGMFLAILARM